MTKVIVTRVNVATRTRDEEEFEVLRMFEKRKLVGEVEMDDVQRELDEIEAFLAEKPRTVEQVEDFATTEAPEEGEDDEDEGGSIVPTKYRILYGAPQNCGDEMALALTAYVTIGRAGKKNPDGGLDRAKLRGVCEVNGIAHKLAGWEDRGLNGGLLRMNTSNVLRGMMRRGEPVTVGATTWEGKPEAERKTRKKVAA